MTISMLRRYAHFEGEATPPADPPVPPPASDAKFTQADLDRVAGDTRKQARQSAVSDLLKELGLEKADDLKALVKSVREQAEANKTEAQKLADAKAAAEKERDEARTALETERQQRVIDRRDSAIKTKASNAHDSDAVLEWASRPANADLLKAVMGDDGKVSEKGIDALIAAARKQAAYLFKTGGVGSPSNANGRETPPDPKKLVGERPFGSL